MCSFLKGSTGLSPSPEGCEDLQGFVSVFHFLVVLVVVSGFGGVCCVCLVGFGGGGVGWFVCFPRSDLFKSVANISTKCILTLKNFSFTLFCPSSLP